MLKPTNSKAAYAALPIVAQSWGDKMDVKVRIGGDMACTDGKTVTIPYLSEDFGSLEPLWGYLLHEAQHVKDTDFSVDRTQSHFFADMVNILEDVRLERAATHKYPGAQSMLDACATYMVEQEHYQHVEQSSTPAQVVSSFCLFYGQLNGVRQAFLQGLLDSATNELRARMPDLEQPLKDILDEAIVSMRSTQDAADYSQKIIDLIKEQQQDSQGDQGDQGESQDSQGDQGDQGESQDSQGDQGDQGESQDSQGDQGERSDSNPGSNGSNESKEQKSQGENNQDRANQSDGSASGENQGDLDSQDALSQRQALQEVLEAMREDVLGDVRDALKNDLMRQHDHSRPVQLDELDDAVINQYLDSDLGNSRYRVAMRSSAALRRQFAGLLQSEQHTADRRSRNGRLGSNLARVVQGDAKLFVRRGVKRDTGAAVHILVDASASMANPVTAYSTRSWLDVAAESAATMAAAVEILPNTSCGLSFYHNILIKAVPQGARLAAHKARLGANPGGSTQTGEAVLSAITDLFRCKQERKQLYVLTDGQPDNDASLIEAIKIARSLGIEVFGVGIYLQAVKRYFDNAVVINDIGDLRTELLQLARKAL